MKTIKHSSTEIGTLAGKMIRAAGVRYTRQRIAVLETILNSVDHPTASQIYDRTRDKGENLSLATVYNCLETMAEANVINQLRFDNGPSRYCSNLTPHAHVMDDMNNRVIDVHLKKGLKPEDVFDIPEGVQICRMNAYLHGLITIQENA